MQVFTDQSLSKWLTFSGPAPETAPTDGNYSWGGYTPAQVIDHLHYNIVIPAFDISLPRDPITTEGGLNILTEDGQMLMTEVPPGPPFIALQFDYSVQQPFTIPNWPLLQLQLKNYYVTIRYRAGTQVRRFVLSDNVSQGELTTESGVNLTTELGVDLLIESVEPEFLIGVPRYSGQLILQNFVIEIWKLNGVPLSPLLKLETPLTIMTSMRFEPASNNDTDINLGPAETYQTVLIPFPALFPVVFDPLAYWLSN